MKRVKTARFPEIAMVSLERGAHCQRSLDDDSALLDFCSDDILTLDCRIAVTDLKLQDLRDPLQRLANATMDFPPADPDYPRLPHLERYLGKEAADLSLTRVIVRANEIVFCWKDLAIASKREYWCQHGRDDIAEELESLEELHTNVYLDEGGLKGVSFSILSDNGMKATFRFVSEKSCEITLVANDETKHITISRGRKNVHLRAA